MKQNEGHQLFFSEYEILWLKRIRIFLTVSITLLLTVLPIWEAPVCMISKCIPDSVAVKILNACEHLRKGPDEPFDSSKWKRSGVESFPEIQRTWHHRWQMCNSVQLMLPKMNEGSVISLLGTPDRIYGINQASIERDLKSEKFFEYVMTEGALRAQIHEGKVVEAFYSPVGRE